MAARPRNRAGMDAEAVARMMAAQDAEEMPPEPVEPEITPEVELASPAEETPPAPGISLEANAAAETIAAAPAESEAEFFDAGKIDGRTLRKTGREPFATRIKPEAHAALRRIAYARRITMAEALELAVAAYEKRHKPEGRKPAA